MKKRMNRGLMLGVLLAATFPLMGVDCDDDSDPCIQGTVDSSDTYYDRFEGTGFNNACSNDADCMIGGCSGEVCSAEGVFTTCEALPYGPAGACGCVGGECIWWTDTCGECVVDADCSTFSNYCDGCACDALPVGTPPPTCSGTIVTCFVDPCFNQGARCNAGYCETFTLP